MANESAVVYARYSSHNQGEQSIEGQLSAAHKYAASKGYTIINEYVDRAMTGRNDNRAEFQRMLSDCAKGAFSVIIVWKVDRFGRNREEIAFNKHRAKKHGVRVEYVAENISEGPEGVILESVLEGMAEYYSLQLSQNVTRGLYESAKKHKVVSGRIATGYRKGPDGKYEVDPEQAQLVQRIFDMYVSGQSMRRIAAQLNAEGLHTARRRPFSDNSVRSILKNEKYTGTYLFKDVIREEGVIPAIIDEETFRRAQEMMPKNQTAAPKRNKIDYLLSGKLYCGVCGSPMNGMTTAAYGKKYSYYACSSRLKFNQCEKKMVRKDKIEAAVLEKVHDLLHDEAVMSFIIDCTWEFYVKSNQTNAGCIPALEKQLEEVNKGIDNLVRSIEAGVINEAITQRINQLAIQRMELEATLEDKKTEDVLKLTRDHIAFFLEQFRDTDFTDRECQRRLIEVFVNAIYVYDDNLKIALNYGGSNTTVPFTAIDGAAGGENFVSRALKLGLSRTTIKGIAWLENVFVIETDL